MVDPITVEVLFPALLALSTALASGLVLRPALIIRITTFILFSLLLFSTLFYAAADNYTGRGIDESVYFHILFGIEGLGAEVIYPIIYSAAAFAIVLILSYMLLVGNLYNKPLKFLSKSAHNIAAIAIGANITIAFVTHPTVQQSKDLYETLFPSEVSDVSSFLYPADQTLQHSGKNLIYIYLESVESTFLREDQFPGLMKNLQRIEKESLSIKGIRQAPMTEWTIAGMTASQCGIPLASVFPKVNGQKRRGLAALPATYCTGDWLRDSGAYLVYMGGADLAFASKGKFYSEHGFSEVMGGDDIEAYLGRALPRSKWGVYDDDLFEAIYKKLNEIHKDKQPYALVALTLDTHSPEGHDTPECIKLGISHPSDSIIEQRLACADYLIGKFFDWFKESEISKNTILIIASDHFIMRNDTKVTTIENRENLFLVYGPGIKPAMIRRNACTMDIAPTVMSLLSDKEVPGLGLGRNLLGAQPTLIEQMGFDEFSRQLQGWRPQLWNLWTSQSP